MSDAEENSDGKFLIQPCIQISVDHRDGRVASCFETCVVDGVTFVHVQAQGRKLERILLAACDKSFERSARNSHVSTIIQELTALRDDGFLNALAETGVAHTHKRKRYTLRNVRGNVLSVAETAIVNYCGSSLRIVLSKPKSKLMVEVSASMLELLAKRFAELAAQLSSENCSAESESHA